MSTLLLCLGILLMWTFCLQIHHLMCLQLLNLAWILPSLTVKCAQWVMFATERIEIEMGAVVRCLSRVNGLLSGGRI